MEIHFARVGKYERPVACGQIMYSGIAITNKWQAVTCDSCRKGGYRKDRPDKAVYQEHLHELRKIFQKHEMKKSI